MLCKKRLLKGKTMSRLTLTEKNGKKRTLNVPRPGFASQKKRCRNLHLHKFQSLPEGEKKKLRRKAGEVNCNDPAKTELLAKKRKSSA